MSPAMVQRGLLTVLLLGVLVFTGVPCLENGDGGATDAGAVDLPWQDELCCESRSAPPEEGEAEGAPQADGPSPSLPRCGFRGRESRMNPLQLSGTCLGIACGVDDKWENVTCSLQAHARTSTPPEAGHMTVRLQRRFQKRAAAAGSEDVASDLPVVCEAEDSFACSLALRAESTFQAMVDVSVGGARAPPVLLRIPARPVKPAPPVNLSHVQTIEAELILHWADLLDFKSGVRYEVRYSPGTTHSGWQVMSVSGQTETPLDLKPRVNYTVQVRCSSLRDPPLWSSWSESHHIFLDKVSYIPEKVVVRPGENVTVYCVFNDHNFNASTALWIRNFYQQLDHSQYHPINQWVSQVTMRPSETGMYDLLQCTQKWTIPYSQIYVEGASIDISCETNGDISAMDCRWNSTEWMNPNFRSRWADLPCDVMEKEERTNPNVGHEGPSCLQFHSRERLCTIRPLRTNCYKLWLEVPSQLGPIRSKPVYLTPIDHVKPHSPTDVKAISRSSGALLVTWKPPRLPVEGLQCQLRYHSPLATRGRPDWKVQAPTREPRAEVAVSDMCQAFVVQVRCTDASGAGYWSAWSRPVHSTPHNSRAPEHGPNFWRTLEEDPPRKQTNVTLLFEPLQLSGRPYCVDGFIVEHRNSTGSVVRKRIPMTSSYSFEWNRAAQTVTVETYNSLGSSGSNVNMTLEHPPKRVCVRSFSVVVINATCVSLSWTLMDGSPPPLFMVVQWSPTKKMDSERPRGQGADSWVRLPYTDRPTYLRGDFFGAEDCGFYLYPVFADGEGEPAYATATRGDPAIYMLLMIISFLSIVLLVSLILSQNQMRKFMWKDVPNPNQCSWARGIDLDKANTFDHMFCPPEGFPAWTVLLPPENISKVVIVDKVDLSSPGAPPDPTPSLHGGPDPQARQAWPQGSELLPAGDPSLPPHLGTGGSANSSAQSSVIYSTVLLCDPKQQLLHLHDKDGGGSSSSDEGNFSANSDISGYFQGVLSELDAPPSSCSYNSVEELSESSEQVGEKDLYYLGMDYGDDEESEEEEEPKAKLSQTAPSRGGRPVESRPLLEPDDPTRRSPPLYLPQFRTAPAPTRQLPAPGCDWRPR